ncbi:tubulin-specific chaperone C [Pangasianodon hypophthalmus]|uniref:tubulin-specific chaperone C n=1 Tax=Pangasianodon hypophthalmus TaxID=310915 RepID=UPI00147F4282|nr:tubulin-specific chaperone C [Pangasianodon hypophthalmus]
MDGITTELCTSDAVKIPESVLRRDQARLEELERRKNAKESQTVSEEKISYFSASFSAEKAAIEELLSSCTQTDHQKATKVLEEATNKLQHLQKFLNDSTVFLTQYELRQAQESLQKLQGSIAEKRAEVMPKKKFAFRSRAAGASQQPALPPSSSEGKPRADPGLSVVDSAITTEQCGFSNAHNEVLIKQSEEIQNRDVLLSHLTNCKVRLYGSPSTLHIKNVKGCQILSGPVSSSVFVDECKDSTLVLACQQLRTHNTTSTQIYLHVTSRAIIEDCHGVSFAPFNWTYRELDDDFQVSGLDPKRNNWSQVDDFNWLAAGMPSPNWTVIPESERTSCWDAAEPEA